MAVANHERLQTCLVLLRDGLRPYCERTWDGFYGEKWLSVVNDKLRHPDTSPSPEDLSFLLKGIKVTWHDVWKHHFGPGERNWISELTRVRNDHAHNKTFSVDDTYRALDTMERLLEAFGASEQQQKVKSQRNDLMRQRYEGQASQQRFKIAHTAGTPKEGLTPWREIIHPHDDVASGSFEQAEFAANLHEVWSGSASEEYQDAKAFYRRTYLTEGLRDLLTGAARRLAGAGGDPVVELQTNFGGGKTHSLIALYHLAGEVAPAELAGVGEMLADEDLELPEGINRAVFVGQWESPADPSVKPDGTTVNTIWGEIAYQLGGADGYAMVEADDLAGTNPGGAKLRELLRRYGPAIILIDEWVAYARQLPQDQQRKQVPAGDFDTQFTFAMSLTEAAAAADNVVILIVLPTSDIEMGGDMGREAYERLRLVVGRNAAHWQPATPDESFEIVRRRLFDPIPDEKHRARDQVLEAFWKSYKDSNDFPSETKEKTYLERMRKSYPIHPELFDRLFQDWSALDKFQRTRGALRLMAEVVSNLWKNQDRNLLIMPGTLPMDYAPLVAELKKYLEEGWDPVIKRDVDGPNALPARIDLDNKQLGAYSATRRVARTIYMGSAPLPDANRGVDVKRVVLGCAQPGEQPGKFTDALKYLSNEAAHLYVDGSQYWYQLQPNVTRVAAERAESDFDIYDADEELRRRMSQSAGHTRRDIFHSVSVFPAGPGEVDDSDDGVSLIILPPEKEHVRGADNSSAIDAAREILEQRSAGPRQHRNLLAFLAATGKRVEELRSAARLFLAWRSIDSDRDSLNLTPHQQKQVDSKLKETDQTVDSRINLAFEHILTPRQKAGTSEIEWLESKVAVAGKGSLPERAANKLIAEEKLIDSYSGVRVRMDLDGASHAEVPLWGERGDITVGELWAAYANFPYMPRLANFSVLATAISNGTASMSWETETFAYAEARDKESENWRGIVRGAQVDNPARSGLVLRPDVVPPLAPPPPTSPPNGGNGPVGPPPPPPNGPVTPDTKLTTFYAVFNLDPVRGISQLSDIMENVSSHLDGDVTLTLELRAKNPDGFDDRTRRTVEENTHQLGSPDYDFG